MKLAIIFAGAFIIFSFVLGIYLYPQMPEMLDSHWNAMGDADAQSDKIIGLFAMPIVMLLLFLILLIMPLVDPKRNNIKKFRNYYDWTIFVIIFFLAYVYLLSIFWNLGKKFDFAAMLLPAFFVLFLFFGFLFEKAKLNWLIGIRTPWTLSSEKVWNETHKVGSKMFKICALITLFGFVFRDLAIWFVIVPAITISIYLFVYSYLVYKKEKKVRQVFRQV